VKVVAEYELPNGGRQFDTLANLLPAGQWTQADYALEVPDRGQALNVSLILQNNGTLASRDYVLTNVTKPGGLEWKRPLVSITFDDGWHSTYLNAVPILKRYGYRATFYINPSSIETPGFMYADELADLAAQHEIAAHGYSHKDMTAINVNALESELKQGKDYLTSAGFAVTDFAPPYGKSDAEVEWFVRKYFTTSRSIDTGINTKQNLDAYNLKTLYLEFNTPPEIVTRALDETTKANGWLILVYHNVGAAEHSSFPSEEPRTSTVSTETFANHMAQVQKSGLTVLPMNAAYTEVSKQ
jgi:peptidoglycan/xylan/chitin deacetylase (PgdA/CDA1 family)